MSMTAVEREKVKLLASVDRIIRDRREIMLAVLENPAILEMIVNSKEFARTMPTDKYPDLAASAIKIAATTAIGIKADQNGNAVRCTKHSDSFIGVNPQTLEEYGCTSCRVEVL